MGRLLCLPETALYKPAASPHRVPQHCVLGLRWNWWVQQRRYDVPDAAWTTQLLNLTLPNPMPQNPLPPNPLLETWRRTEKPWNQPPPNQKPSIWERQTDNHRFGSRKTKNRWTRAAKPKAAEGLSWLAWQKGGLWVGSRIQSKAFYHRNKLAGTRGSI